MQPRLYRRKATPENYCRYCGKKMERRDFGGRLEDRAVFLKRKYCNRDCMAMGYMNPAPKGKTLRKRIVPDKPPVCGMCNATITERLNVHHLDGNRENNDPTNLMILCNPCHTKWHWENGKVMPSKRTVCRLCDRPEHGRGLCQMHLQRMRKYGDPLLTKVNLGNGRFELMRVEAEYKCREV